MIAVEWFYLRPGRAAYANQLALEAIVRTRACPVQIDPIVQAGLRLAQFAEPVSTTIPAEVAREEFNFLHELFCSGAVDLDDDEHVGALAFVREKTWFFCMCDDQDRWREVHALRDYFIEIGRLPSGAGFKELQALMESHR